MAVVYGLDVVHLRALVPMILIEARALLHRTLFLSMIGRLLNHYLYVLRHLAVRALCNLILGLVELAINIRLVITLPVPWLAVFLQRLVELSVHVKVLYVPWIIDDARQPLITLNR